MINSFKNPAIMRILRTTERHGAGWREQNFIPDDAPRIQLSYVIIFVSPTMKYIADSDTESVRKLTSLTDFRMD